MLRKWQDECVTKALAKYGAGDHHFFCQATPGAGKTVVAASISLQLLDRKMVDLVVCFSPQKEIAEGIEKTFSSVLNGSFSGGLGSLGVSLTY